MHSPVCVAIGSRRLLAFEYGGHERVVEPHSHGRSTAGRELLRAYQVEGTSSSGRLGWKLFDLERAGQVVLLDVRFVPRPDFRLADQAMHPVHCTVRERASARQS